MEGTTRGRAGLALPPFFFVFDVESVGLHGLGFAAGWVVVDSRTGATVDTGIVHCPLASALHEASESDITWVQLNVVPGLALEPDSVVPHPRAVRVSFWSAWRSWQRRGALLCADVPWPVEGRFLNECMETSIAKARIASPMDGPYPLIDIASIRLAKGIDPIRLEARMPDELPVHNPLADARQSARLLLEALAL